ncbi:low-specificity L-threonine aldolase, partial [Vibrio campbellii]
LAEGLAELPGFSVNPEFVQTNIVFAKLDPQVDIAGIAEKMKEQGITITPGNPIRFVTHKDISAQDIDTFLSSLKSML